MQRMIDHKDMTLVLKEKELSRLKDNVLKYHMPVELSYFHYTIDDRNLQKSLELPNKLDRIITTEMKNTGCKIEVCKDHLRPNPLREENWALKKEIVELLLPRIKSDTTLVDTSIIKILEEIAEKENKIIEE